MSILIVDDSKDIRLLVKTILNKEGYTDIILSESAKDALKQLKKTKVDLILMDIMMPEMDGIEACRVINANKDLLDIPVIMVTAKTDMENLQLAFATGALDYVTKPFNKVELLARVGSALKLKYEMDKRKAREKQLMEVTKQLKKANQILHRMSSIDGLTGIANRRVFDKTLESELRRSRRGGTPLSLILTDVDYFKAYNDTYGHLMGDDCLKKIAKVMYKTLKRPTDTTARYGGEEFACVLANADVEGACMIAGHIKENVASLNIRHEGSPFGIITVSMGVASIIPDRDLKPKSLIAKADKALYHAKEKGRNRVEIAG